MLLNNDNIYWEIINEWKNFTKELYKSHSIHKVKASNYIEYQWINLVEYFGDFYLLIIFYFFMNLCYMLGGLLFWFCDKFKLLHKYKIQIQKYPNTTDYIQCIWNLIQNYILIIFPLLYISYPIFTKLGFSTALPLPSFFTWSWQIFFFMLCEDISHYFLHRLLHTPYLYKKIHKIHHIYSSPFGLAASFAHPLEVLILGAATFSGPLIIIPHYFTFYSWVLYRQLDAVITHSGYNLPNLLDILPFYGGTTSHDFHHKSFIWNYSSRFTFMDKLFGTYKDPSNSEKLSLS